MTASLAISGVLLIAMAVTAGYAVVSLPRGARFPVNAGMPEYSIWLAKPVGLAIWLAGGAVAFGVLAWLTLSAAATDWATSMRVTLPPAVLCVVLAGEAAAVITARQAAGLAAPLAATTGMTTDETAAEATAGAAAKAADETTTEAAEAAGTAVSGRLGGRHRQEQPAAGGAEGGARGDDQPGDHEEQEQPT
jgi:hypothetical protein